MNNLPEWIWYFVPIFAALWLTQIILDFLVHRLRRKIVEMGGIPHE